MKRLDVKVEAKVFDVVMDTVMPKELSFKEFAMKNGDKFINSLCECFNKIEVKHKIKTRPNNGTESKMDIIVDKEESHIKFIVRYIKDGLPLDIANVYLDLETKEFKINREKLLQVYSKAHADEIEGDLVLIAIRSAVILYNIYNKKVIYKEEVEQKIKTKKKSKGKTKKIIVNNPIIVYTNELTNNKREYTHYTEAFEVRGHLRTYKNEDGSIKKQVWVKPFKKGNGEIEQPKEYEYK